MAAEKKNLLLLFDRPQEPVFMPKGDAKTSFSVPPKYLVDRYKSISVQLMNRFGGESDNKINVTEFSLPSLGDITSLGRQENFSLFIPLHAKLAAKLVNIFMGMRNLAELQSMAVFARDRVNPYMFNYALSVAILHRKDTKDMDLPSFVSSFPDKYVDSKIFSRIREEATVVRNPAQRIPIEIPLDYTASDLDEEHRVAYFREDMGVNLHHWHWHLVYPFEGPLEVVNKNRRGELFYYMHQQIIARYNCERFCNKLNRVERLIDWRNPIKEGYFPKMDSLVASRGWPARMSNSSIQNLDRSVDQIRMDLEDLERYRDRVFAAIHAGFAQRPNGQRVPLDEATGIDTLGNMIESSVLSPNRDFYGQVHNNGHVFMAYIHDPDHRFLESFGVIGDSATAMRDPVFYRWHAYIDDIFQEYKATLPRYTVQQLSFQGIQVQGIEIKTQGSPNTKNRFVTYWQKSNINLSRGMDFQPRGPVYATFTHLDHMPFTYRIQVNNQGAARQGTCRIFIGPKVSERGAPMLFSELRLLMVELDKFTVNLKQGQNIITRNSNQSSVTIPFERVFRDLDANRPETGGALEQFNFCGCGWPEYMLLPKGTPEGYRMQLFVMISNFAVDEVKQNISGECNDSGSYCGIRNKLYPDSRSMGYPFDRMGRPGVDTIEQFLTPNMRLMDVTVNFNNRVVEPGKKP